MTSAAPTQAVAPPHPVLPGLLMAVFGSIAFSGKAIIVKLAYRHGVDAVTLIMYRMLFALPVFVAMAWWANAHPKAGQSQALTQRDWLGVLGLGFTGYYLASFLDFVGLQYISASLERLILYLNPTLVLLLGWLLYRKRIARLQAMAEGLLHVAPEPRVIEKLIDSNPALQQFKKQLLLDITSEGLRIQIVDEQNRPMFDTSSSDLKSYTRVILREIGKVLNSVPSKLSLTGHTDAALFGGGEKGYSNWELSANRANASRREMIAGGMDEHKVLRVVGLASTVLFDKNDPLSSINRRISIIVLNKRTEEALLREDDKDKSLEVGAEGLDAGALAPSALIPPVTKPGGPR